MYQVESGCFNTDIYLSVRIICPHEFNFAVDNQNQLTEFGFLLYLPIIIHRSLYVKFLSCPLGGVSVKNITKVIG